MEAMHGDWQHMTEEEAREALEAVRAASEASTGYNGAMPAEAAAEDAALAAGGWGAVELEATAPAAEDSGDVGRTN